MSDLKPIGALFPMMDRYLEELREKYGSRLYEIDPYAEVFRLRENVWAIFMPCTHNVGDNWVYLIEGSEKALLIDNGYGIGDLKGLCEQLTGKEILCAVTHNHGDHAGGSPQWDAIYCHDYCADILESRFEDYEAFWNRFNHVGEEQHRAYFKREDVVPFRPYKCIRLPDHGIIDLGGDYEVEMIHMGGHAPGLCAFLDKKGRILYGGDSLFACGAPGSGLGIGLHSADPEMPHGECMGIVFYHDCLKALCGRLDEFDAIMAGHGFVDAPCKVATDTLGAVEAIMADPWCYDKVMERHVGTTYIKFGGTADVMYVPEDVIGQLKKAGLPIPEKKTD